MKTEWTTIFETGDLWGCHREGTVAAGHTLTETQTRFIVVGHFTDEARAHRALNAVKRLCLKEANPHRLAGEH